MKTNEASNNQAFSQVLREIRKDRKMSQKRLCEGAGLDRTYISLLERGLRGPSLNTITVIAKALGIKVSKLIEKLEQNENFDQPALVAIVIVE